VATRCSIATASASLVGALALLLAPAAVAGRVDIEVAESGDSGFVDEYGVFFHPRSGENNHLHVRRATEDAPIFVRDSGASLRAGSSCRARSSRTVRCYLRGVILSEVILRLGDGDDVASLIGVDGILDGGTGNDDLETRNGDLYVGGGAGADRMFAGGTTGGIDVSSVWTVAARRRQSMPRTSMRRSIGLQAARRVSARAAATAFSTGAPAWASAVHCEAPCVAPA
jgi:hypothetical protein